MGRDGISAERQGGAALDGATSDISREFLYLCLRARWDPSALDEARHIVGEVEWGAFEPGELAPLLYAVTRGQDLLPSSVEEQLRGAYYHNARRNLLLFHQLQGMLKAFTAREIPLILLKGGALAGPVYGNVALRPLGDFDLLVREGEVTGATELLIDLGYAPIREVTLRGEDVAGYTNEVHFYKPGAVVVNVDLHWKLFEFPYYYYGVDMDWFWETAAPIEVEGRPVLGLGPEAQVLYLCGHLIRHSGSHLRLLGLHDLAEVLHFHEAEVDWEEVLERARAFGLLTFLQRILPRVVEGWRAPLPAQVLSRLRSLESTPAEKRAVRWLAVAQESPSLYYWAGLKGLTSPWLRLRYVFDKYAFPSPRFMRLRYDVPHPALTPFYYPYRWALGVARVLGGIVKGRR